MNVGARQVYVGIHESNLTAAKKDMNRFCRPDWKYEINERAQVTGHTHISRDVSIALALDKKALDALSHSDERQCEQGV
jgi:hypothetical protein